MRLVKVEVERGRIFTDRSTDEFGGWPFVVSMQDRTMATSDGLRVPSPQRAPLYMTVRWRHRTDCEFLHHRGHHSIYTGPYGGDIGRTASSFTTEGTTLSMQDRTVATSNGLRVPSPQKAPLYLCRTVRWRHRTDCEFLHHRGHHSIYAGPYGLFTAIR